MRRGMKVSCWKREYMSANERGGGTGTVKLQGRDGEMVHEFRYFRSTVHSKGKCGKDEASVGRVE